MIADAFLHCIHDGFRPQTFLLGVNYSAPHPVEVAKREAQEKQKQDTCKANGTNYIPDAQPPIPDYVFPGVYKTLVVNAYAIEVFSMGPQFMEKDISYITPIVADVVKGPSLHPDFEEDNQMSACKRLAPVIGFTEDIDDIACKRHHYRAAIAGSHCNSVATQTAVYARIRAAVRNTDNLLEYHESGMAPPGSKKPRGTKSILLQYPEEYIADETERLMHEDKARPFEQLKSFRMQILAEQRARYRSMTPEEKKRHGVPTEITAADFICDGRFSRASADELIRFKEDVSLLQLEHAAQQTGKPLTQEQRDSVKSSAVVPYVQAQNQSELEAARNREARKNKNRIARKTINAVSGRETDKSRVYAICAKTHLPPTHAAAAAANQIVPTGVFFEATANARLKRSREDAMAASALGDAADEVFELDNDATMPSGFLAPVAPPPSSQQQQQPRQQRQAPAQQQQPSHAGPPPMKKGAVAASRSMSLRQSDDYD